MKNLIINLFLLLIFNFTILSASENFYNFKYSKEDLKDISKNWEYRSGILKDSQNKIVQYNDKLLHLDGYKNLLVISLIDGKEICRNIGKKDRAPFRGISIYKTNKEVFAVFIRQNVLQLININNCKSYKLKNEIKIKGVSTPVLIHKSKAIILPNGNDPRAYNLENGKMLWKVSIDKKKRKILDKYNLGKKFHWDVWGGGTLDLKYNQVIFSTANAKPSFVSSGREGPNLFYNSIVSLNLENGKYNWHFQEIEHDLLNLDLASRPALYNGSDGDLVIQASKTGQLILLNRKTGEPLENFKSKVYYHNEKKKIFTKFKKFDDWLQFSKRNFNENDINNLNSKYENEAKEVIKKSIIGEYKALRKDKHYIHYGMHGGSEWPGIGLDLKGNVIIPASNIAWKSKLNDPKDFNFGFHVKQILLSSTELFTLDFNNFKMNIKKIIKNFKKLINFKKLGIEKYQRFETKNGIPLNAPPWGTVTLINLKDREIKWTIPHGSYPKIEAKYRNTGSEVFGCPVIAGSEVIFLSGTRDKKIYAYNLNDGSLLWKDQLPFISYGCPIIANYNNNYYLIIDASGGRKFTNEGYGDAIISYKLK